MATTAKPSSSSAVSSRASSSSPSPQSHHQPEEEDIETIAKQISDHAEAIYQTWKARGLAPTEILNCHTVGGGTDTFGKALTPPISNHNHQHYQQQLRRSTSKDQSADLLYGHHNPPDMSNNNNLEKLVSSFVNEDKARQQQAAGITRKTTTTSILTSGTIRDALRKFETNGGGNGGAPSIAKPNFVLRNSAASQRMSGSTIQPAAATTTNTTSSANTNHSTTTTTKLCKNVPDVLMNTIEQTAAQSQSASAASNKESSPPPLLRPKPETPTKPASLINHQPTWPLKNRIAQSAASKKSPTSGGAAVVSRNGNATSNGLGASETDGSHHSRRATSGTVNKSRHSANLMDEVLLEEERLINALKTGTLLSSDKTHQLPEVITSTMQPDSDRKWSAPDISTTNGLTSKSPSTTSTSSTKVPQPATAATAASPGICSIASTITAIAATASATGMPHEASDSDTSTTTSNSNTTNTSNGNDTNGVQARLADLQQKTIQDAPNSASNVSMKVSKSPRPRNDAAVPHPEISLSTIKLNHITNSSRNPGSTSTVRPFLTRGSVAERVLMFEKCPELKPMRIAPKEPSKLSVSLF